MMKIRLLLPLVAIGLLLAACKGKYEPLNNDETTLAQSTTTDTTASAPEAKLVKTASMQFKVKDVEHTNQDIAKLTTDYQGMVMHHEVSSAIESLKDVRISSDSVMRVASIRTAGQFEIKVPSDKLEQYMDAVSKLGVYVTERKMDIDDKSLDYLAAQMKLKSRDQIIHQQKQGKIIIKDPAAVMNLKDDMIDQQITNMKINDAVKYSVVDLSFYQSNRISKEIIANDDPAGYTTGFFTRLKFALVNGFTMMEEILLAIANLWLVLIGIAAIWTGVVYYKKRSRKVEPQV